jgi:hypothetical protein
MLFWSQCSQKRPSPLKYKGRHELPPIIVS